MTVDFIPKPPRSLWRLPGNERRRNLCRLITRFPNIIGQAVTPFNDRPEEPTALPDDEAEIAEEQVAHCEWIFDQAERRATTLEQKAQWTFGLIAFLAPILGGGLMLFAKQPTSDVLSRCIAIALVTASSMMLLLGFVSALRAVSVRRRETLFLASAIDMTTGQFREYNTAFRARGLLYCASMNAAMNDHIANFVKASHVFTAAAVLVLMIAAIPASLALSNQRSPPVDAKITTPITISSQPLSEMVSLIADLREGITKMRDAGKTEEDVVQGLNGRLLKVEADLATFIKVPGAAPPKSSSTSKRAPVRRQRGSSR